MALPKMPPGYRLVDGGLINSIIDIVNGVASGVFKGVFNGVIGSITPALGAFTYVDQSAADTLTAAGTTRADALALTSAINNVTTAAASTGVVLPASATVGVGGQVIVFNAGANAIKVYAAGSDTIDGTAGSTGVTLTNARRCAFIITSAGKFVSAQLGAVSA